MKINWHRQHKISSLIIIIFLILFCISGVLLNHRGAISGLDVSRRLLPGYRYERWNGGLVRGSVALPDGRVALYGNNGVFVADSLRTSAQDDNLGFPSGADRRNIRSMAVCPDGKILALSTFGLYSKACGEAEWTRNSALESDELFTDMVLRGDSLIVISRSDLYLALPPYNKFDRMTLKANPELRKGVAGSFRTVWLLHSGQLFGLPGILLVDAVAIVLIVLCVTGIVVWILPKSIKRRKRRGQKIKSLASSLKSNLKIHRKVGVFTIPLTLIICFTGWCLRPPLLIPLALTKMPVIPGSTLDSDNPWHDKLRMIRHDDLSGKWLISTSEGFFSLDDFGAVPEKISKQPPVSVMGLNVWERIGADKWLCGSFSGIYEWDPATGESRDFLNGDAVKSGGSSPFGGVAVSGYSGGGDSGVVFSYSDGAIVRDGETLPQVFENNEGLEYLPMSLWNVALELHVGRLIFGSLPVPYVFLSGLLAVWCLFSGYKATRRSKKYSDGKKR